MSADSATRAPAQQSTLSLQHLAFAAVAAPLAMLLAGERATPIDRDLPLIALLVVALVWVARESRFAAAVECALPAMLLASLFLPDDRTRLMAIGIVVGGAFVIAGAAAFVIPSVSEGPVWAGWRAAHPHRSLGGPVIPLVLIGIILLRCLPTSSLEWTRELVVLGGALALLAAQRERSPLAVGAVLAVAAVTPIHPGRAMLFPYVVALLVFLFRFAPGAPLAGLALLIAAHFARDEVAPLFVTAALALLLPLVAHIRPLALASAVALFALWPWSGVVARSLPLAARFDPPAGPLVAVNTSLTADQSVTIAIPPRVRRVVVTASGENIPRLRRGKLLATIETLARDGRVCSREVRTGDVADFGFLRRDHFFLARNPFPARTPFEVYDFGATSFVKGNGRVAVACGGGDLASLRVTAAPLPAAARLQIESIELPAR
jgi:MFS family permease